MEKLSIDFEYSAAPLILILCLAFSFFIAFYLYKKDDRIGGILKKVPFYKYLLISVRAIALFLVLLLIIDPKIEKKEFATEPSSIILLSDQSTSIATAFQKDSIQIQNYLDKVDNLKSKLGEKFQVQHYGFDQKLDSARKVFKGKGSNLHYALQQTAYQSKGQNIAGIVLLSDGITNEGKHPNFENYPFQAPVFTLGLGDTTLKKDISITNVEHHDIIYLDNDFEIKVDIHWSKIKSSFPLQLYDVSNGQNKLLKTENFYPKSQNGHHQFSFIINPDQDGIKEYKLSIPPQKDEHNLLNNHTNFFIEVIDGKQKILILAANISPDIKALRSAISSNQNFEVTFQNINDYEPNQNPADLAILLNPDKNTIKLKDVCNDLRRKEISSWFFISDFESYSYFKSATPGQSYPNINFFELTHANNNEVSIHFNPLFLPFQIEKSSQNSLLELPAINGFAGLNLKLNENQVLMKQKIGNIETNYPMLYFHDDQSQKLGIFFGSDIWKWRQNDYFINGNHNATNELITKSVQYLSNKTDKRKFKIIDAKRIYNESEEIIIKAKLYNDNYEPIQDEQIDFTLKNDKGESFEFRFTPYETDYRLNLSGFTNGQYTYTAKCKQYPYDPIQGSFHIEAFNIENYNTIANHHLLSELAYKYNGFFTDYAHWKTFEDKVLNIDAKDTIFHKSTKTSIVHFKWLFFLIILLLSVEWSMRKFLGGY